MSLTLQPGVLRVASAYEDPPFDHMENGVARGFDLDLMRAVCSLLHLTLEPVPYHGDDFDGIFEGLVKRTCDVVISGTTITPGRSTVVLFSPPYLEFNQAVAVNRKLTPKVSTTADLHGMTAGIQSGNTSDFVAKRWLADGTIAKIQYYPYSGMHAALDDLEAGRIGLVIKLFPVISWLVKSRPDLVVVMQVPTHEQLGIAYARDNQGLCDVVNDAVQTLHGNGEFARLQAQWFPAAP